MRAIVELAEIEAVLGACPGVSECAVLLAEPEGAQAQLVAYVARQSTSQQLGVAALRERLALHLPSYMVPSEWHFVGALPRTLNQKLDRAALSRSQSTPEAAAAPAHATPLEQTLCALVAALLPGRTVQPEHDFFRDLGGDSLLAIRLIARVEAATGSASLSDFARKPPFARGRASAIRCARRYGLRHHPGGYVCARPVADCQRSSATCSL